MSDDAILTVMTYNSAAGVARPDLVVQMLHYENADIIGIQELAPNQAEAIAAELREQYPFQKLLPLGIPGKGLLSRFPIRELEILDIYPERPDLRAVIEAPGVAVTIIVAHPPPIRIGRGRRPANASRAGQIARLIELVMDDSPAVLLGDFNLLDRQRAYRHFVDSGLIDAFARGGIGSGATLPTRMARWATGGNPLGSVPIRPMLRFDYIWHTHHWKTIDVHTGWHAGSDHRPVIGQLRNQEPGNAEHL